MRGLNLIWAFPYGSGYSLQCFAFMGKAFSLLSLTQNKPMQNIEKNRYFQKNLMSWFSQNQRDMPWKGEKNPYLIWLSEIILQQTTVRQGLPYFEKITAAYPNVFELADTPDDTFMKHWEGLGYYSRARNLLATARYIAYELNGSFPNTYEGIIALKGIGAYTAAAIASFAYNLPYAVVDGNVYRVLSRYFGIDTPIDSTFGKKEFGALAQILIANQNPCDWNQAIMDFGATQCKPQSPICKVCFLKHNCSAFQRSEVGVLPVKSKKLKKKKRFFNYVFLHFGNHFYIKKREAADIWRDLYEFPQFETADGFAAAEELGVFLKQTLNHADYKLSQTPTTARQLLTHQEIHMRFWEVEMVQENPPLLTVFLSVELEDFQNFAFPRTVSGYLTEKFSQNSEKQLTLF
jgi:A/G-specific adenine glycosylase